MCKWVFWALFNHFRGDQDLFGPLIVPNKARGNLGVKKVEVTMKSPKKMAHYVVFQQIKTSAISGYFLQTKIFVSCLADFPQIFPEFPLDFLIKDTTFTFQTYINIIKYHKM
jgi:hypothetical protein